MPNRFIKESICTSETLNLLSAEEERLFYRIIVQCDDFGRMESHPQIIRTKCLPWKTDKIDNEQVEAWLQRLREVDLIVLYSVNDKRYLQVKTWERHQQIRAKHSKFPAVDEGMITSDNGCNQPITNVPDNEYEFDNENDNEFDNGEKQISTESGTKRKEKVLKNVYGEFQNVKLAAEEHEKLVAKFGPQVTETWIKKLSTWKESKGKATKSDYATILNWSEREGEGNGKHAGRELPRKYTRPEEL